MKTVLALLLCVSFASADLVSFDVDAADALADETQAGFLRMTVAGMNGNAINGAFAVAGTIGATTVTAQATGTGTAGFRDRGTAALGTQPFAALLRDFIFQDGASGVITVTLAGLAAGYYDITTFHHDWNVWANSNPFDIRVDDAMGTNQLKVDNGTFTPAMVPYLGESFRVWSNVLDNIVLRITPDGANNGIRFNGISIAAVPEPATLALVLFSGVAALCVRRRRRTRGQ